MKKAQKKDAARSQKRAAEKEAAEAAERQEQEGEEDDRGLEAYEKGPRKLAQVDAAWGALLCSRRTPLPCSVTSADL